MGFMAKCLFFIFSVLLTGSIVTLVVWNSDYPDDPLFTVERASISGYKLTSNNHLTATFNVLITATNPNTNYFIYYDVMLVSVYDNSRLLAYNMMSETQAHHPNTKLTLKSRPVASDVSFNTTILRGEHETAATMAGVADLEVQIRANTRFHFKGWKKVYHMIKATCYPIVVNLNSSSKSSGIQDTECYVFVY